LTKLAADTEPIGTGLIAGDADRTDRAAAALISRTRLGGRNS